MKGSVYNTLASLVEVKYKSGDVQAYLSKLVRRLNGHFEDNEGSYEALPDAAQKWFNKAVDELQNHVDITLPDGFPTTDEADEDDSDKTGEEAGAAEDIAADNGDGDEPEPEEYEERKPPTAKAKRKEKKMQTGTHKNGSAGKVKSAPPAKKSSAKSAKSTKGAKPAKGDKEKKGRVRKSEFSPGAVITLLSKNDPHREGTINSKRWKAMVKIGKGLTVQQAFDEKIPVGYLRRRVLRKHIAIK